MNSGALYLAGPIDGLHPTSGSRTAEQSRDFHRRASARASLWRLELAFYDPALAWHGVTPLVDQPEAVQHAVFQANTAALVNSRMLVVLVSSTPSAGTQAEMELARNRGIPIAYWWLPEEEDGGGGYVEFEDTAASGQRAVWKTSRPVEGARLIKMAFSDTEADPTPPHGIERPGVDGILDEVGAEIQRAAKLHGAQRHLPWHRWPIRDMPDTEGMRANVESALRDGALDWQRILVEEVCEACDETDPAAARVELVQVAAMAVAAIRAIDHQAGALNHRPSSGPANPGPVWVDPAWKSD